MGDKYRESRIDWRTFDSLHEAAGACGLEVDRIEGSGRRNAAPEFQLPDPRIKPTGPSNPDEMARDGLYGYFHDNDDNRAYEIRRTAGGYYLTAAASAFYDKGPDYATVATLDEVASRCGDAVRRVSASQSVNSSRTDGWSGGWGGI